MIRRQRAAIDSRLCCTCDLPEPGTAWPSGSEDSSNQPRSAMSGLPISGRKWPSRKHPSFKSARITEGDRPTSRSPFRKCLALASNAPRRGCGRRSEGKRIRDIAAVEVREVSKVPRIALTGNFNSSKAARRRLVLWRRRDLFGSFVIRRHGIDNQHSRVERYLAPLLE